MAFPQILAISSGSSSAVGTTHKLTFPSGTLAGELLVLIAGAAGSAPGTPTDFNGNSTATPATSKIRYAYRYANGSEFNTGSQQESGGAIVDFTTSTTVSEKVSYVILRFPTGSILTGNRFSNASNVTTPPTVAFRGGADVRDYTIINALAIATSSAPTGVSTGYTFLASQSGFTDASTIWVQKKELTSAANTTDAISALTLSQQADVCSVVLSVTFASQSNVIYQPRLDNDFPATFQISASLGGSKYVGQTFPGNGSQIDRVGFNMRRTSSPVGILTCSIYLMTGSYAVPVNGYPSGSRLVSSSTFINATNLDSTYWQYEEFVFDPPYRTVSEQYYVFVIESPGLSGGSVSIGGSSGTNNLYTGNSVSSSDGITWAVGNDLYMMPQIVKNDSQYYIQAGFESQSIVSNKFEGWYSIKPTYLYGGSGIRNVSISSASSFQFVSQSIVYDSTAGKNVYAGWSIKDNTSTSETDRAQVGIDFWDDPNQFTEWKSRTRMKFHSDWNYLWQNFSGSIGTGSAGTGTWQGWIDISEIWLQDAVDKGLFLDGNTGGSARWGLNLAKASASLANPARLFWKFKAETMAPLASEGDTIWPPDLTQHRNGERFNRTVDVPIDEWFWLEWYFKKGSGSVDPNAGRVTIKIETAVSGTQVLFDEKNTTQYASASVYLPQIMLGSFDLVKTYASSSILNFMSASNKKFEIRVSDFEFYNLSYPNATAGSFSINNFAGIFNMRNYKWIPS